ncbi:hypothetical protein ACTHPB_27955 [Priestia megaterium]|uniref:hypothetical protein n=1 Tax=Priestia megaterium TaxID=1404 RepID=UPI003F7D5594
MAEVYNMKALSTFYGTGGYIVAGQEFFTTSKAQADAYYHQGKAVYTDGTEPAQPEHEDLKLQAKYRYETPEKQTEFKTSELERNVTSMANPVNIKISVDGVNPEDLNVEVVRDEKVEEETVVVQENQQKVANHGEQPQAQEQKQAQPQQQQQAQPQETSQQPQYSQQNQQPQQQQAEQSEEAKASQELQSQEQQLIQQLNEIRAKQEELKKNDSTKEQPVDSQNSKFEARHVGGGWYDLPNGERVQGKDNAEMRLQEIQESYQHLQGQVQSRSQEEQPQAQSQENENVGKFQPNQDKVRQANTPVEDGASLNEAQVNTYAETTESGSLSGWNGEQENQGGQAQAGMAGGSTGSTGGNAGGGNTGGSTGGGNTGGSTGGGNTGQ